MAYEIAFFENLVYKVFGSPVLFTIMMIALFGYYWMKYDISFWTGTLFITVFILWLSWTTGVMWLFALVIILASMFIGIELMRRISQ